MQHFVYIYKNALSSMGKILVLDFFRNFIFFTEGSCEQIMNDQALLIISIMAEKWFRKILFIFNLTRV